jgi:hypothetical protein
MQASFGDALRDISAGALDLQLARMDGRGKLTFAVSNPLGNDQREY